jgi:hypothetical protein
VAELTGDDRPDAKVRDLFARTDTPPPARPPGYRGLLWRAAYTPEIRRWEVQGFAPGVTFPGYRLAVSRGLDWTSQEEVARVVASLLGSITEDEGSLMAASLMQEGERP